jgi:tRNA U34 5-methylaminomethyl-2-thiouridine-forming methyltransferase MnmC
MKTELLKTSDGSHTLFVPELNETFHSTFGAVQESMHVFIKSGLDCVDEGNARLNILEMGFGTGLNALLAWLNRKNLPIHYTTFEAFPLQDNILQSLNFTTLPGFENTNDFFDKLHKAPWNLKVVIAPGFEIEKYNQPFETARLPENHFDLVFFDAFAPDVQPELWTLEIFQKVFKSCRKGAILVTYSSKGQVKRNLKESCFEVEKLPGPPGKRHILRGRKI